MNKLISINKTAWIAFFISLIVTFIMVASAHAQESSPEQIAKKYNVTFPITELGSCKNFADCRNFCEDPLNSPSCIEFAKAKGFYKDDQIDTKKDQILEKAKQALGCDSIETCKTFCQVPTNYDKCDNFAKQQNLAGGRVEDPSKKEIIERAKQVLGCESYTTCAAFCSDDANKSKCSEFAKETGLRGGERPVGPGGCTSEESCKAFCSLPGNFQVCSGFVSSSGGNFKGPGGCDSEQSCRSYCERNPDSCAPKIAGAHVSIPVKYDPQEMCNRTPACSWKNNTCQCGSYNDEDAKKKADENAKFCKENPVKCAPGGIGGFETREEKQAFEKFCRENPEKCRPAYSNYTGATVYNPAIECSKYGSCSWINGRCECSTRYANAAPLGEINPEKSCTSGGCKWTGNGCDCSQSTTNSPALACGRQPGCSWINSACQCASANYSTASPAPGSGGYNAREEQEKGCRAGGGSCSWNGDTCNCQGYRAPSTSTYTGGSSGTTTNTTQNITSSGMSRDQQEAGCRGCGGTCNWSGDFCNCQCGSTSSSGGSTSTSTSTQTSTPAPAAQPEQTTQPAPQPEQQQQTQTQSASDPATACAQTSGCSWNGSSCQCSATQGVSTVRSWLERLLDLLR